MAVNFLTEKEIELMRESGRILAAAFEELAKAVKPGISTLALDELAEKLIREGGALPAYKNYHGYMRSTYISINNEVGYGVPNADRFLKEGDIVSIDAGAIFKGYYTDAARMFAVGEISPEKSRLIESVKQVFFEAVKFAKVGNCINDVSAAIEACADRDGFAVVREMEGHGIGRGFCEEPRIRGYRVIGREMNLGAGMGLDIVVAFNQGSCLVNLDDGRTTTTMDGLSSAHYGNTVIVTDGEPEIITEKL